MSLKAENLYLSRELEEKKRQSHLLSGLLLKRFKETFTCMFCNSVTILPCRLRCSCLPIVCLKCAESITTSELQDMKGQGDFLPTILNCPRCQTKLPERFFINNIVSAGLDFFDIDLPRFLTRSVNEVKPEELFALTLHCEYCNRISSTPSNFIDHSLQCAKEQLYSCQLCDTICLDIRVPFEHWKICKGMYKCKRERCCSDLKLPIRNLVRGIDTYFHVQYPKSERLLRHLLHQISSLLAPTSTFCDDIFTGLINSLVLLNDTSHIHHSPFQLVLGLYKHCTTTFNLQKIEDVVAALQPVVECGTS